MRQRRMDDMIIVETTVLLAFVSAGEFLVAGFIEVWFADEYEAL